MNLQTRLCIPAVLALTAFPLSAAAPIACPAGAPLGRFALTVSTNQPGLLSRPLQSVNLLSAGDRISYRPEHIDALDKKKARLSLLLVPSQGARITVTEPKPASEPADWLVPSRTGIVSLVWGPEGLDRAKVTHLVAKDEELIGQLADYAARVQETQNLLNAITQQQALAPTQNVGAAVAGFASAYPNAPKLDRTAPTNEQMLAFINGVNPALSVYDPLAPNPQQRAAQTAGLAAAVAGLFFGNGVGLAAGGGAVLVNLHSLLFPNTEFRSALAQNAPDSDSTLSLCGNKVPSASRTELAFLWGVRVPDSNPPEITLTESHLPIGIKSSVPIEVRNVRDPKLAARAEHWTLISDDGASSMPFAAKVSPDAKSLELDLSSTDLKPGKWKIAASWDWSPLPISGDIELHRFSDFSGAHLAPASQDHLTSAADTLIATLTGTDFEFVQKLAYKRTGDPFAQSVSIPFRRPDHASGPAPRLDTELKPKSMGAGSYVFLIAQNDGKEHEIPFQVLPPAPEITNLPLTAHVGSDPQVLELHGNGLDRIEKLTASNSQIAEIALGDPADPAERKLTIRLAPNTSANQHVTLSMTVKGVSDPVTLSDALTITGEKPSISDIRKSISGDVGIALQPDEIPFGALASFAINAEHARSVRGVELSCAGQPRLKIGLGETTDAGRLRQESPGALFLSLNTAKAGQPGCALQISVVTQDGASNPRPLGTIVQLPNIDSFQLTDEKAGDSGYIAILQGKDLETIEKAGWSPQTGLAVDAIPTPVTGQPDTQRLRVVLPWPAPAPHAPLYVWLRGESTGRLTSARY